MLESSAIGESSAAAATSMSPIFTSSPPSFTRSSCFSSPVTLRNVPTDSPEMMSAIGSDSSDRGCTSCAAPDSSRSTMNCTFFWSRTVSTHPDTRTGPSGRAASSMIRVRAVMGVESNSLAGNRKLGGCPQTSST